MFATLPELEQTISALIVELLLLEKENRCPHLLFGPQPEDSRAVRVSAHYVSALLDYGFQPDSADMQRLVRWFDRPFPKRDNDHIDPAEMNRLMVLLHLRPQNNNVQSRLEQLVRQKDDGGFDVQPGWSSFDTLWAVKLFNLANEKGVLNQDIIKRDDLESALLRLLGQRQFKRDKDRALALRLEHEMLGEISEAHLPYLERLIETAKINNGVWGLEELGWRLKDMDWLDKLVKGNKLTSEEVRPFQQQVRRVVLSTCMVIENLAPLVRCYPQLHEPVERAMGLWWEQFYGQNATPVLQSLFPRPHEYDYILVLCRTMRALRRYLDEPLCKLDTVQVHILRELAEAKVNREDPPDVRDIKLALRHWIRVDLNGEIEPLKLGFSEANVVRVRPHIWSPMVHDPRAANSLITQSLIIKYGPSELIKTEQKNYEDIPAQIRDAFVRIPKADYTDESRNRAFVIMQDLRDYKTLYEVREDIAENVPEMADWLGSFLGAMHDGGSRRPRTVSKSLLREIYLRKMMEYVDRIFDFVWDRNLFPKQEMIPEIQDGLFHEIGELIRRQGEIPLFPAAHMHGDLHMRNIMVYGLNQKDGTANGDAPNRDITFKLIDLEYYQADGDAAFDAGQLLMDIELISREETRYESQEHLMRLRDGLARAYQDFSVARNDPTFGVRVELAKARALLRIAKGKTKRGGRYLEARQSAQAEKIAEEVMLHAAEAWDYLKLVVSKLN